MWTCPICKRIFQKTNQSHSCKKVTIGTHFKKKEKAKKLFDYFLNQIEKYIGPCRIISLPCCIHLFGVYDFLAVIPKKDGIEIRFALNKKLVTPRLKIAIPLSCKTFKNCFDVSNRQEIDSELIKWLEESYHLKD